MDCKSLRLVDPSVKASRLAHLTLYLSLICFHLFLFYDYLYLYLYLNLSTYLSIHICLTIWTFSLYRPGKTNRMLLNQRIK